MFFILILKTWFSMTVEDPAERESELSGFQENSPFSREQPGSKTGANQGLVLWVRILYFKNR
jgi:hypothetical protein